MNRRLAAGLIGAAVLVLVIAGVWWARRDRSPAPPPEPATTSELPTVEEVGSMEVRLYFPGQGGRLYSESRSIAAAERPEDLLALLANEVLAGPTTDGLYAPFPAGTHLRGIDLVESSTAYVDLASEEELPPAGSRREMLMVYSLVDSLVLNTEGIERLGVLWNGTQRSTFSGHVDLTRPLAADLGLVVRGQ